MKPERLEDILDRCLKRIADGEDMTACLRDEPEHADVLAPLLQAAVDLRAWEQPRLSNTARATARARAHAALASQRGARRPTTGLRFMQRIAIAAALVAAMMSAVDTTSAQSLPGETLYQWKRAKEDISLALVTDSDRRSHLLVEYAGRRLNEFNQLVDTGKSSDPVLVAQTLDSMFANLAGALDEDRKNQSLDVAPEASQLLAEAKSEIAKAGPVASPDTVKVLDDAVAKANLLAQQMPPVTSADVAPLSTSAPTDTPVIALQPTNTADVSEPAAPSPTRSLGTPTQGTTFTPMPTRLPCNASPTPTSTPTETLVPPTDTATPPMPRLEQRTWTPTVTSGHGLNENC
jgi:hypothetical protein